MTVIHDADPEPDVLHTAWSVLDEASQVLLRAEAIVVLMGSEAETSVHVSYATDVAGDLLRTLKAKLVEAQQMLRPPRKHDSA